MQVKVKDISKWYRMISFIISLLIYMRFIFTKERSVHTEVLIGMTISCALLLWLEDNLESSKVLKYAVILIELVWNSFFLLVSGGFMALVNC